MGWLPMMPIDWPSMRAKPHMIAPPEARLVLEEILVVDNVADDCLHVIGRGGTIGDDLCQCVTSPIGII